jgi:hypothetical protein
MGIEAFPFTRIDGMSILAANERTGFHLSGEPLDGAKETHIRAGIAGREKRCASLHEACA